MIEDESQRQGHIFIHAHLSDIFQYLQLLLVAEMRVPLVKKLTNITTPAVLDHDTETGGIGRHHPVHWHYARMWSGNQTKCVSVVHHAWQGNSRHPKTHRNPFMTAASPMKSPLTSIRSASVMPVVDIIFTTASSAAYLD